MDFETIILKKEDGIATIIFNRPERLNALDFRMFSEIPQAIREVAGDETVRVLVLTGAGRAFSVGGDFKGEPATPGVMGIDSQLQNPAMLAQQVRGYGRGINLALQNLDIPTIAMVNGVAVGQGFSMALVCDMRIGSQNARFSVAWTKRALVPATGDTWLLPRIVGLGRAVELILTGRFVEAEEAERIGLLNRLVPVEELENETMALAHQLAKGPPLALRLSKVNLYTGLNVDLATALESLSSAQAILFMTEDYKEATAAFQEKREAVFKGR